MKKRFTPWKINVISILCLAVLVWSQSTPGSPNFSYYNQIPLERHMSGGGISQAYASSVGGVAFSRTAETPEPVESISLDWNSAIADGSRLQATINGQRLKTSIYDWQLVPTANFADSKYDAAFTMFGSLQDKSQEEKITARNGRILNYHSAFLNTLVGLRLMQLDFLIEDEAIPGLIKGPDGAYIMGAGETMPNLPSEERAGAALSQRVDTIDKALDMKFRSYIVSDYNQKIVFSAQQGALTITGNPYYYCWRSRDDRSDYDKTARRNAIEADVQAQVAAQSGRAGSSPRAWLIAQLLPAIREYAANYHIYDSGTVAELADMNEQSRPAALQRYSASALHELLVDLRVDMESSQVEYMKDYSDRLSGEQTLLRAINPAVWDTGTTVMRYAAFFRYAKQKDPQSWRRFLATLTNVPVNPKVRTPTGMN